MSVKNMLEVLSKCHMFTDLERRERYYLLRYFQCHKHMAGEIVIHEGEPVMGLYVIAQGEWEVFLPKNEDYLYRPAEIRLHVLESGDLLGEYSFIDHQVASASVRALEDGELYTISRDDFYSIVDSSNRVGKLIYRNLLQALIIRLRHYNEEADLRHLDALIG